MSPVFFIDRDLGGRIFPSILEDSGLVVERHLDHFKPDAPDIDWIPEVARRGWFAVTNDVRIYRTAVEREVVMNSGLGLFVIPGGHLKTEELARNFVACYPAVLRFINKHRMPFIASIHRPTTSERTGTVHLKYPRPDAE